MHYSPGVITHLTFVLAQPTYLATRYLLGHLSFESNYSLYLAIHVVIWGYIVTRINVPFFTSELRRLPSPPGEKFLLGHLDFNGEILTTLIENMVNNTPNDGLLFLWGPLYLACEIIPTQPETLLEVLNTRNYDWEKPPLTNKVLGGILGEGLVNVEGAKHKAMRRVVAPSFSGHRVRTLTPLFYSKGITLAEVMAGQIRETSDRVLELTTLMSRATLDIIGSAGVGKDFNTIENETSLLAKLYNSVTNRSPSVILVSTLFPHRIVRLLKGTAFAKIFEEQSQLRKEVGLLTKEKKVQVSKEESTPYDQDIIASIMRSGDFSDDYLVSQMLTFLAAGHDTTASALLWATWLVSLHPKIQDRLRTECNAHLANASPSDVDAAIFEAENMPFLTAVCNETLRLYAPVPSTARHAVVPTTVGGVCIPKGTTAIISAWAINRSCALWGADAGRFNPDRWLSGPNAATGGAKSPHAFLTFLHGPRSCIGQGFARLELKCLLAALVIRFRFEPAEPNKTLMPSGFVTIKPAGGLRLKVYDLKEDAAQSAG